MNYFQALMFYLVSLVRFLVEPNFFKKGKFISETFITENVANDVHGT